MSSNTLEGEPLMTPLLIVDWETGDVAFNPDAETSVQVIVKDSADEAE